MSTLGYPYPGHQTPTVYDMLKDVYFVSDFDWDMIISGKHRYDLIIIGSGFCGLAVAIKAFQNNPHTRVLMIERGNYFLPTHFQNLGSPYTHAKGGLAETFPWTLSHDTFTGQLGPVKGQHGMVPFFGGRSTLWSAWCPRPTEKQMVGWPKSTIDKANKYFGNAETLLNVQSVDKIDQEPCVPKMNFSSVKIFLKTKKIRQLSPETGRALGVLHQKALRETRYRPLYDKLQAKIDQILPQAANAVPTVERVEPARIASNAMASANIDFLKFSTPTALLELIVRQKKLSSKNKGAKFDVVCNCVVEKIIQHNGKALALRTSRGNMMIYDAKLILAMGTLPTTTLVDNSFPDLMKHRRRFSTHFMSAITARVPIYSEVPKDSLEVAASYISGWTQSNMQYHIQLSGLSDQQPDSNQGIIFRYMPSDLVSARQKQLDSSIGYVIFICATLGELDYANEKSWFVKNDADSDLTTNSILQIQSDTAKDKETWDTMDQATFDVLDLLKNGTIEYWTKKDGIEDDWDWGERKPNEVERRMPLTVHESSTLHIGDDDSAPVGTDYKLRGTANVYITGGALWPTGGSWNPTLTMVALAMDLTDQLVPAEDTAKDKPVPNDEADHPGCRRSPRAKTSGHKR